MPAGWPKGKPNLAKRRSPVERFWARTDTSGGPDACWPFNARKTNVGYCHHYISGDRKYGTQIDQLAHRFSWELHHGERIPAGLKVDHTCKMRHCVNPAHLRVTTQRVNSTENSDSPLARNARKTHCKHGHPFSGENLAIVYRTAKVMKTSRVGKTRNRICLTCFPSYWRHAVIPRSPPPNARFKAHERALYGG